MAGQQGFVGGTDDPTSLTHLGAREYDPVNGRFLSVDPVLDAANPQSLNGYAYSNSNPLTHSDPTGLRVDDGTGHSEPYREPPARAPHVDSKELRNILNDIYIKPGRTPAVGNGKVAEALRYELKTGLQVKERWHIADAADQLRRLTKLLEDDRAQRAKAEDLQDKSKLISEHDRAIALSEAEEIWNALDQKDETGKVGEFIRGNDAVEKTVRKAADRAASAKSMESFTGGEFYEDPRGYNVPRLTNKPRLPRMALGTAVSGLMVVGTSPSYVRTYGWKRGAWEMFKDGADPLGVTDDQIDPFFPEAPSNLCDPSTASCA